MYRNGLCVIFNYKLSKISILNIKYDLREPSMCLSLCLSVCLHCLVVVHQAWEISFVMKFYSEESCLLFCFCEETPRQLITEITYLLIF